MAEFAFLLIALVIFLTSSITFYNTGSSTAVTKAGRYPVILVPGIEGSRLEAKLDKKESKHWFCDKTSDWDTVWLELRNFLPLKFECFSDDFVLQYNVTSRHSYNQDGVQSRPYKFGDTEGVQFLDRTPDVSIFNDMVSALLKMNYTINENLRGAPYDFRLSHYDNIQFTADFKTLIEETYGNNSNTPVYLVTHSMGGLYTLYFLDAQPQAWRDKYIKGFISVSGPWGGAGPAMAALAIGDNFGLSLLVRKTYRSIDRSLSSTYALLPSVIAFRNQTLVSYEGKDYTVEDYDAFFDLYDIPNAKMMYEDTKDLTLRLPHPMVDVYCIHGNGHDTVESLIYESKSQFPDKPRLVKGPGDGTVNLVSLEACQRWSAQPNYKFNYTVFDGIEHVSSVSNQKVIEFVSQILTNE